LWLGSRGQKQGCATRRRRILRTPKPTSQTRDVGHPHCCLRIKNETCATRPLPPPVKLPARSPSIPCNKTTAYRVTQGILGATNLTLAGLKTVALGGADTVLAAAAPFTGGATAVVAAGVTVYGVTSIGGQATSGTGQLYTAFTGDAEGGEGLSQVGDILAGPLSGISTLLTTNDPALAQRNANAESLITAGSGLVGKAPVKETIQSGVDTALSLFGIGGNGCPP